MRELSMHILDIAQNSVRGQATEIKVTVAERVHDNIFEFSIDDNGTGIPDEIFKTIKNPFTTSRTHRKVGLGIPLLNDTCTQCGGELLISTELGVGTKLHAWMTYNHIDRPPLGDIAMTIVGLITSNEGINIQYVHSYNEAIFEIQTKEIQDILGDVPLYDLEVYKWMKDFLKENLDEIRK
ncbi:MAG: sensor histidine kinase [Vallitaleaceae bacterium]|nr:sensor histidine kinase [Vallitaleaceae bacterium]